MLSIILVVLIICISFENRSFLTANNILNILRTITGNLSGINVKATRVLIMVIVQVYAVIAGVLVSSQVMSGSFSFGSGWEMTVISAVIIGGASLSGGKGKITDTLQTRKTE